MSGISFAANDEQSILTIQVIISGCIIDKTSDVVFSAITEAELVAGKACEDEQKKRVLLHFLARWKKIPVSNPIACLAGDINRKYGLLIPDALIAATALTEKSQLITRNLKDFKKVPNLTVKAPY